MAFLNGDNKNNTLLGSAFDDTINGFGGNDTISGLSGRDLIFGGGGNDDLSGGNGNDILLGENGNDTLEGGAGNDYLDGGNGYDVVIVNASGDVSITEVNLFANNEFDRIVSIEEIHIFGNDTAQEWNNIFGGSVRFDGAGGNDTLRGGENDDTIIGGSGNDQLFSQGGDDRLDGGTGFDVAFIGSTKNLVATDSVIKGSDTVKLRSIERLNLISEAPSLTIDARAFSGSSSLQDISGGNSTLLGGIANDTFFGAGGNDLIDGGDGNDTINGGTGTDTARFRVKNSFSLTDSNATGQGNDELIAIEVARVVGTGSDQFFASAGFSGRVVIDGKGGNDTMQGAVGDDRLLGGDGNDYLLGYFGNDTLQGGDGRDTLEGEADNDLLIGGKGTDLILGGVGNDTLTSGNRNDKDIFSYANVSEGGDLITDFDSSDSTKDRIRVAASGFLASGGGITGLSAGKLPNNQLVTMNQSLGSSAGFRYREANGKLFFDSDGGDKSSGLTLIAQLLDGGSAVGFSSLSGAINVV